MIYFILRRTFQSVLTVLGVVTFTFFLVRLAGDPTALLLPVEASDEDIARLRAALGLDQSWIVQYWKFLANAVSGDFGVSLRQRTPALDLVLERLPATLELALTSFVLGMVLAPPLAVATQILFEQLYPFPEQRYSLEALEKAREIRKRLAEVRSRLPDPVHRKNLILMNRIQRLVRRTVDHVEEY